MASYLFVVLSNARDGEDDAFNDWYTNKHLAEILAIPGIVDAQRFVLSDAQRSTAGRPYRYLAIYRADTDNLPGLIEEFQRRRGEDLITVSEALADYRVANWFTPITPRLTLITPAPEQQHG